ncbi:hypothetical protein QX776_12195 [Alteromonadaceae bacterium BrNp21-10]|nr:hypothetical protein [Alteromonadaceae bacterium BrNp21-10]
MNLTAIAIVAIAVFGTAEIIKQLKKKTIHDTPVNNDLEQKVVQLQERVATLEKIVTDQKYDLKQEINSL